MAVIDCMREAANSMPRGIPSSWRQISTTAADSVVAVSGSCLTAAARSVAEWQPPTDFLLRTPGNDMLTSTPRIPDLKGIPR